MTFILGESFRHFALWRDEHQVRVPARSIVVVINRRHFYRMEGYVWQPNYSAVVLGEPPMDLAQEFFARINTMKLRSED